MIAIENVRLFDEVQARTRELRSPRSSCACSADQSGGQLTDAAVFEIIVESCGAAVQRPNVDESTLSAKMVRVPLAAYHGQGREKLERHFPVPWSADVSGPVPRSCGALSCTIPTSEGVDVPDYARRDVLDHRQQSHHLWRADAVGRPADRRDHRRAASCRLFHRKADRAAQDLRRPGGDRDRERAAVRRRSRTRAASSSWQASTSRSSSPA